MTPVLVVLRSVPLLCRAALGVPCPRCHVGPGDLCVTTEVPRGVHLCRMATAVRAGLISMAEFVPLLQDDFHTRNRDPRREWAMTDRHPRDLHPGDPIDLAPHKVWDNRPEIGRSQPATIDGKQQPLAGELIVLYWHDHAGAIGATVYRHDDWIHLRRSA